MFSVGQILLSAIAMTMWELHEINLFLQNLTCFIKSNVALYK